MSRAMILVQLGNQVIESFFIRESSNLAVKPDRRRKLRISACWSRREW